MAVNGATAPISRATIEWDQFQKLPEPKRQEVSSRIDAVVQHTLLGDDPVRYSKKVAEEIIGLQPKTVYALLQNFGSRLRRIPFTVEGVPSHEEVQLTNDLWNAVGAVEQNAILARAAQHIAQQRKVESEDVPNQKPYCERLLHRFMQIKSRED